MVQRGSAKKSSTSCLSREMLLTSRPALMVSRGVIRAKSLPRVNLTRGMGEPGCRAGAGQSENITNRPSEMHT